MLNLFRRIRKSLLASGAVRRYVLYALGEIALVVIGILIALQINNWNERHNAKITEVKLLAAILDNLKEDEQQLRENEKILANSVTAIHYLNSISIQNIIPDTLYKRLAELINFYKYHPIDNAYETMKSTGLALANHELHNKVSKYYEYEQSKVMAGSNDIEIQYNNYFEPFLRENIQEFEWLVKAVPYKLDQVFLDTLKPHLVSSLDNNSLTLRDLQGFIQKGRELQLLISKEIDQNKKYLP